MNDSVFAWLMMTLLMAYSMVYLLMRVMDAAEDKRRTNETLWLIEEQRMNERYTRLWR